MQIPHALEQEQRIIRKLQMAGAPLKAPDLLDRETSQEEANLAMRRLLGQGRVKVSDSGLISLA